MEKNVRQEQAVLNAIVKSGKKRVWQIALNSGLSSSTAMNALKRLRRKKIVIMKRLDAGWEVKANPERYNVVIN